MKPMGHRQSEPVLPKSKPSSSSGPQSHATYAELTDQLKSALRRGGKMLLVGVDPSVKEKKKRKRVKTVIRYILLLGSAVLTKW